MTFEYETKDHSNWPMARPTLGQLAYESDCALMPRYHTGAVRKVWSELRDYEKHSWEKNPTPRTWAA